MDPQDIVVLPDDTATEGEAPDASLTAAESDLFPNLATDADRSGKVRSYLSTAFSELSGRSDLEEIWEKNDEMYRVTPDPARDSEHRANEATGVFHVAINQLVAMGFKTLTDNIEDYRYEPFGLSSDESEMQVRKTNADILTQLYRIAQQTHRFVTSIKRVLFLAYKYGVCFPRLVFPDSYEEVVLRDKQTGKRKSKKVARDTLPYFEATHLENVFLDENVDEMADQSVVFFRQPLLWRQIFDDHAAERIHVALEGEEKLRDVVEKYGETVANDTSTPKSDRFDNADRSLVDHNVGSAAHGRCSYKHWIIYARLPIADGKWDENGADQWYRVRILGDPGMCQVIEVRQDITPGGIPFFRVPHTMDDLGMYPISLGGKIATYYDQLCTAVNQLMDNRSKNNRRPVVYNPLMVKIEGYDFGHANGIPCDGDPRAGLMELQIADMTGNIMQTIQYLEQKVRELMNTTDAVVGEAMGGRTSASEYQGAKVAATTPIFCDLGNIEQCLIVEYMKRFAHYVHAFLTTADIIRLVGKQGASFRFELDSQYKIVAKGVMSARDKQMQLQNLLQLSQLTQDPRKRDVIMLRIAELSGVENPSELVPVPATDQAVKAALWENNELLIFGQWDEPEPGELHDVHLPIHVQAAWQAKAEKSPNVMFLERHIRDTETLARQESMAGSGPPGNPAFGSQASQTPPPTPGQESGWNISGAMGSQQAGSPIPMTDQAAV